MSPRPTPLERLRRSGIHPERTLGQNFLIDPNILKVIERAAALAPGDVALEVGPGLGVLTELLVEKCAAVHCVELDRRLASSLQEEFAGQKGFQLHLADAVRFDFTSLKPAPNKFVANLPYNVAAPLVIKSFEELPQVNLWCLMVQKEIASRLFAATGSPNYGGISVITRLMAEKVSARVISESVFYPRPRVRSSLLVFRRREPAGLIASNFAELKEIIYAMFSHRRKKLVNSLSESGATVRVLAGWKHDEIRAMAEDVLCRLRLPADVRAQALEPPQIERLAAKIVEEVTRQ